MPRIGRDEWVATHDDRSDHGEGLMGRARQEWDRVPPAVRLAGFVLVAVLFPFTTDSDFLIRVGINVLLFAILAIGLNVTVGWTGMLDLGFVAFYGFGAYVYAFLSSGQFDLHWPTEAAIVIAIISTAFLGLLLGLPSRRLVGDYLAIITLFFSQMFFEITTNLGRVELPFRESPADLTGGVDGIPGVDAFTIFGIDFDGFKHYFYFLLILLVVIVIGFYRLNQSRTGRAWRAIREDPLAAETMTIPTNRLRLLAFAFGAATAGLAGTVFAAVQQGVFPGNFQIPLLIMIYAALVLGGTGSIAGAILGAVVIASVPNVLRPNPVDSASWLFYLALLTGLVLFVRPWKRLAAVLLGTAVLGFIVRGIGVGGWPDSIVDVSERGSNLAEGVTSWMIVLENSETAGNVGFILLVLLVLAFVEVSGVWRTALMVPILYLGIFVWENRLVVDPSITRQLLFGAILVVLMAARPQGLLGTKRVEVT